MDNQVHNQIVSFIWGIADDCLRDVYVRGNPADDSHQTSGCPVGGQQRSRPRYEEETGCSRD